MNDMREALAQIISETMNGGEFKSPKFYNGDQRDLWLDRADAIIAALPGLVADLEWETANETVYWCDTPYGRYSVWETLDGEGYVNLPSTSGGFPVPDGMKGAKAVAQEDYTGCVLSAFGPKEQGQ